MGCQAGDRRILLYGIIKYAGVVLSFSVLIGALFAVLSTERVTAGEIDGSDSTVTAYEPDVLNAKLLASQGKYRDALDIFDSILENGLVDSGPLFELRVDFISALSDEQRQAMEDNLRDAVKGPDKKWIKSYMLVLVLNRKYGTAVNTFEGSGLDADDLSGHLLSWIAWAYFKTGDIEKSKKYYEKVLQGRPADVRAKTGLAYCLAAQGQSGRALDILDGLLSDDPMNIEVMFARVYVFEESDRFWDAIREYEHIIEVSRENHIALKYKLLAFSGMGTGSYALERANEQLPGDLELNSTIAGDMAAARIHWKEYADALSILKPQAEDGNLRARYDSIVAFVKNEDMQDAVQAYEELLGDGMSPPEWVKESAAAAYMYLERPHEALELYDEVLKVEPGSFTCRLGRFYVRQELREWEEAKALLNDIDRDTPEFTGAGRNPEANWPKVDIKLAQGWLMLSEDRLEEAQKYFRDFHGKSPANTGFRTGLSYAYLWRGWPRKALREFNISNVLDPKDVSAQTGRVNALNELAFKEQARDEARALLKRKPKDKDIQALNRELKLEEMRELFADFAVSGDDDGFSEVRSYAGFTQPVSLYTNVYTYVLWLRADENNEDMKSYFRRSGLGVSHIFNSSWRIKQEFSVNYNDGRDFGSFTELDYTPDDYWAVNLLYDSFTTDVPLRARTSNIEADKFSASVTYRASDSRSYGLSYSRLEFSDGNNRNQGLFTYEQGLYVKNDWKMRLFLDSYLSSNSLDDAPYFNPDNDFSISATHMTEQTIKNLYREAFIHRLYLSLGMYKQNGFSGGATGSVRYEHDIDFSDRNNLLYGVSLSREVYDGEAVTGHSFYSSWRYLF